MNVLTFLVSRVLYQGSSKHSHSIEVIESFGNQKLLINGIVQSGSYPRKLFSKGVTKLSTWHTGPQKKILVLGIGGGDIFRLLSTVYPDARMTGVDIDATVVRVAKEFFHIHTIPHTRYIIADANAYLRRALDTRLHFDSVIIDIYTGNVIPDFVMLSSFFRKILRILRPKGSVMFNYFSYTGQKEKKLEILALLQKIYTDVDMVRNRRNIFYYCRA